MASIDDLKNLLVNDVDVRRAIAVAAWGGGGAASPMYVDRIDGHSEYPETALFSLHQRVAQLIAASQDAIIAQITAAVTKAISEIPAGTVTTPDGSFSEPELISAVQKAITGATITATTETK